MDKAKRPMVGSSGSARKQASGTTAAEVNKDLAPTKQSAAPPSRSWAEVAAQNKSTSKGKKGDR